MNDALLFDCGNMGSAIHLTWGWFVLLFASIWTGDAVIHRIIIITARVHSSMIGSIMNSACVWNIADDIAIDVAIVGLVIGVRFVETPSWIKQPLESWPGQRSELK